MRTTEEESIAAAAAARERGENFGADVNNWGGHMGGSAVPPIVSAVERWIAEAYLQTRATCHLDHSLLHRAYSLRIAPERDSAAAAAPGTSHSHGGPGSGGESFETAGRRIFASVRRIQLRWRRPAGLSHVVSDDHLRTYESLFVSNLALKCAVYALHEARRFLNEARDLSSSRLGRKALQTVQLLLFLLDNVAFTWQVDVQDSHFRTLLYAFREEAKSVDEALRAHSIFIEKLVSGAFLDDEGKDVARCIGELVVLSFSLFCLVREDSTRRALDAATAATTAAASRAPSHSRSNSPRSPGGSKSPPRYHRAEPVQFSGRAAEFETVLDRVLHFATRRVVGVFAPLRHAQRAEHRALWTRVDFNGWISRQEREMLATHGF
jgi:hypothetical protein